jgi:DNA-binding SARP family transcriptional activator
MDETARYRVLGQVQVRDRAGWSAVAAAQQRLLLAVLLAEAGRVVSTARLTDEIWAGRPPRTALNTIQGYVVRLRRRCGTRLSTVGAGYQLSVAAGELDAAEFGRLAAAGRAALSAGRPDRAAADLRAALALWRGPALADVRPSPVVTGEARRLEEARLSAVEDGLDADLALGQHAAVTPELGRLVAEHPLRERLRAQLMLAHYRSGRRADALAAYRQGRTASISELGLEPGLALRGLEHAILTDAPALAPAGGHWCWAPGAGCGRCATRAG